MRNKTFRDDLLKKWEVYTKKKNNQIEDTEKLQVNKLIKNHTKKKIMETFYKKLEEIKKRPLYEEAKVTHLGWNKNKNKIIKNKEKLQKKYEEEMEQSDKEVITENKQFEDAQIAYRWKNKTIRQKIRMIKTITRKNKISKI